jgi:hypothetical protein
MVWTSKRPPNANVMGNFLGLLPLVPLEAFWTRNDIGLQRRDYLNEMPPSLPSLIASPINFGTEIMEFDTRNAILGTA